MAVDKSRPASSDSFKEAITRAKAALLVDSISPDSDRKMGTPARIKV